MSSCIGFLRGFPHFLDFDYYSNIALRLMGRLANFHVRPSGDFPVSDFTDLRTTTVLRVVFVWELSVGFHGNKIPNWSQENFFRFYLNLEF